MALLRHLLQLTLLVEWCALALPVQSADLAVTNVNVYSAPEAAAGWPPRACGTATCT